MNKWKWAGIIVLVIFIILAAYFIGQSTALRSQSNSLTSTTTSSPPADNLAMKAQCSKDGQAYFQTSVVAGLRNPSTVQIDEAAGITNIMTLPSPTFAYNQAMNTCLIDYWEVMTFANYKGMPNAQATSESIDDIYSGKTVTSIITMPNGSVEGYVGETKAIFDQNKQNLMVNGEECVGGNDNCG